MTEQLTGVMLSALALCVVAIVGLIGNVIVKRMRPGLTTPDMWARVDKLTAVIYGDGKDDPGLLERVAVAEKRADTAESESRSLHARLDSSEAQSMEMIHHIVILEEMVPNPPGPPVRPNWKMPILTDKETP